MKRPCVKVTSVDTWNPTGICAWAPPILCRSSHSLTWLCVIYHNTSRSVPHQYHPIRNLGVLLDKQLTLTPHCCNVWLLLLKLPTGWLPSMHCKSTLDGLKCSTLVGLTYLWFAHTLLNPILHHKMNNRSLLFYKHYNLVHMVYFARCLLLPVSVNEVLWHFVSLFLPWIVLSAFKASCAFLVLYWNSFSYPLQQSWYITEMKVVKCEMCYLLIT